MRLSIWRTWCYFEAQHMRLAISWCYFEAQVWKKIVALPLFIFYFFGAFFFSLAFLFYLGQCSIEWWSSHFYLFITLVHPLHGNPYPSCWHQLMGISIARWLASSMWDFLLFCLLHITPIIVLYSTHSAISMACSHVLCKGWKGWSALKSMNQLLGLSSGLCMMRTFVWRYWNMA